MEAFLVGAGLWFALSVVVISLARIARAADRTAESQEARTRLEEMKFGVAIGLVNPFDLVKVEVPDSPPEDP